MTATHDGDDYWNHNTHYHPRVLAAVPPDCRTALDVGCGDGLLARKLARHVARVTGVDRSPEMIERARESTPGDTPVFVEADFLTWPPDDAYDFVTSVATIHHMDFTTGITRIIQALRPGGTLFVLGLANNATLTDWVISAAGVPASRLGQIRHHGKRGPGAPILDPTMTWSEVRQATRALLPGAHFRRHLLWRYSILWHKPL